MTSRIPPDTKANLQVTRAAKRRSVWTELRELLASRERTEEER